MYKKTLAELSKGLQNGDFSSEELTQHYLARINLYNPELNCFITVAEEQAIATARAADNTISKGNATSLTGIPIVHKDIFCTKGLKTSCGSLMLDNFIAPYDATVVSKMNNAGTVILGKSNMDEFAMGSSNENSYYGPVKNPWHKECVPGGSSGGSSAAVAARLTPAATGTDTGGSIRQPAALCGVTGIKPTYGRISRYGMIAFASSLDQAGPFAQTAEDCAMLLNDMVGFDAYDSTSLDREVPDYTKNLKDSIKGLKVGLPKQYFDDGLDSKVSNVIDKAIEEYKKQGVEFIEIELPNTHYSVPVYYIVASAECSSNLSRYDGVRFGYRAKDPKDLQDMYERSRGEGFGAEVKRRIMIGTYVLSAGYFDAYYIKAQQVRQLISEDFKNAFKEVDVIMGPTSPTTAFKLGERSQDPIAMYLSDIYTIAVNLSGLPGISIPVGMANGLPVGLQIVGNYFKEAQILNIAHQYQQLTDWHLQCPPAIE